MRKFIVWLLALGAIIGSGYYFRQPIQTAVDHVIYYSPCDTPIAYRVGSVDPRFNITSNQFNTDIRQAANIWNSTVEKQLFILDPAAKLTINMVYDQRQYLKNQIDQQGNKLSREQQNIEPQINQYDKQVADFNKEVHDLNAQIEDWNKKGGAPPDIYQSLINQQQALRDKANQLKTMAQKLNRSTAEYNVQIGELNQTIKTFNQTITAMPEEGLYDGKNSRIDIYFNVTKNELVHTLAHELGHALGLDHLTNADAIMYPLTTQTISTTSDDIQALNLLCQKKNKLEYIANEIMYRLEILRMLLKSKVYMGN